jgi:hypothetical protein
MDTNDIRPAVEDQVDSTLDKGKSYLVIFYFKSLMYYITLKNINILLLKNILLMILF